MGQRYSKQKARRRDLPTGDTRDKTRVPVPSLQAWAHLQARQERAREIKTITIILTMEEQPTGEFQISARGLLELIQRDIGPKLLLSIKEFVRQSKREWAHYMLELGIIDFSDFSEREQAILRGRFIDLKTLEEVGKDFGVTRDRIRQIEAKLLLRIRSKRPTHLPDEACDASCRHGSQTS